MSGLIAVYVGFCCTSTAVIPVIGKAEKNFRVKVDFLVFRVRAVIWPCTSRLSLIHDPEGCQVGGIWRNKNAT
jgi:hypothetical protein